MTESTSIQPAPVPGLFARFIGILTAPRATFEKIVPSPTVFGAMALVALVATAASVVFMNTEVGKAAFMDAMQQRASANPNATPEQLERMAPIIRTVSSFIPIIFVPIATMVITGVLFVIFNVMMGGNATFRQMTSVVAHSQFVSVIGSIVGTIISYMRGAMLGGATNLSVFMPNMDEHSFVFKLARSVDLFLIWWLVVLSIGLSVLYRRKTSGIAMTLFSIYFVVVALIAFLSR